MQPLVLLVIAAFVIGGTRLGSWVRERWWLLLPISAVSAAGFYSLRVVL
jgi:hypothetical protein